MQIGRIKITPIIYLAVDLAVDLKVFAFAVRILSATGVRPYYKFGRAQLSLDAKRHAEIR